MLIAGGLVAALAVLLALRLLAGYPPAPGTRALRPRERALVAAAADVLFPAGGERLPLSGGEAGVAEWTDRYVAAVPPATRRLMRALFLLLEHATLVFPAPGRAGFRRFTRLSPEQQEAVLEAWRRSRFFPRRLVFTSLRAILTMGYFGHPAVLRELRLAPYAIAAPVTAADALYPPLGRGPEAIARRPEEVEVALPTDRPPAGEPLDLDGPLHPAYRSGAAPRPEPEGRP